MLVLKEGFETGDHFHLPHYAEPTQQPLYTRYQEQIHNYAVRPDPRTYVDHTKRQVLDPNGLGYQTDARTGDSPHPPDYAGQVQQLLYTRHQEHMPNYAVRPEPPTHVNHADNNSVNKDDVDATLTPIL